MTSQHIIIGPGERCFCGIWSNDKCIFCADVIKIMKKLEFDDDPDVRMLCLVISGLIREEPQIQDNFDILHKSSALDEDY